MRPEGCAQPNICLLSAPAHTACIPSKPKLKPAIHLAHDVSRVFADQDGLISVVLCHPKLAPSWGKMHAKGKWLRQKSDGEVFLTYDDSRLDEAFQSVWCVIVEVVEGKHKRFSADQNQALQNMFSNLQVKLPQVSCMDPTSPRT